MRPEARDTRHTIGLLCEQPHLDALAPCLNQLSATVVLGPPDMPWLRPAPRGNCSSMPTAPFTAITSTISTTTSPFSCLVFALLPSFGHIRTYAWHWVATVPSDRPAGVCDEQSMTRHGDAIPPGGSPRTAPSDAHTESAYSVFITSFATFPFQYTSILQLEGWVYRIAMTSTFRERARGPEEYRGGLDKLVGIWAACRISCGS
ncbi:hypothetical protein PENSUB_6518 [Penicillium subrubescens]|uniref:Uncharacterized protein n=1 Tax=Penicillium subrubescens TaxID=1316194 RepID=A0A1Q5U0R1_9EURO|nr:hypothetical protein PENSUB_6518 [Penicillium subrubescens]